MDEQSKEFWGINFTSLLATSSFVLGAIAFIFSFSHITLILVTALLALPIFAAIVIDIKKGLSVKWRKANLVFHIFFIVFLIGLIVLRLLRYFAEGA